MLNLVKNPKDPDEIIFNEQGLPVPPSRVERFLRDCPVRAILFLKSGESFAGALDGISYSSVSNLQDGSEEGVWRVELFYFKGSSLDTDSLEFSQFEKFQSETLIVFNDYVETKKMPEDVLLAFKENALKMEIARDLVNIMRRRLETAKSVLSLIELQMYRRDPVTAEQP